MFISPIGVLGFNFTSRTKGPVQNNSRDESYRALKTCLDNYKGEFVTPSGKKITGTIKDYIKACMLDDIKTIDAENMLHGTSTTRVRDAIINNGFDANRISRTLAGPGVCFTGDEYTAISLGGSCVVKADFRGRSTVLEHGFYKNIENNAGFYNALQRALIDTGFRCNGSSVTDRYVRDVLVEDLGIDAAQDPGKHPCYPPCFAVYNTSKIFNIRAKDECLIKTRAAHAKKEQQEPKKQEVPPNQRSYYWGY